MSLRESSCVTGQRLFSVPSFQASGPGPLRCSPEGPPAGGLGVVSQEQTLCCSATSRGGGADEGRPRGTSAAPAAPAFLSDPTSRGPRCSFLSSGHTAAGPQGTGGTATPQRDSATPRHATPRGQHGGSSYLKNQKNSPKLISSKNIKLLN